MGWTLPWRRSSCRGALSSHGRALQEAGQEEFRETATSCSAHWVRWKAQSQEPQPFRDLFAVNKSAQRWSRKGFVNSTENYSGCTDVSLEAGYCLVVTRILRTPLVHASWDFESE